MVVGGSKPKFIPVVVGDDLRFVVGVGGLWFVVFVGIGLKLV